MATQRVVGAVARGGKEGHLTKREATAKTLRVIQQMFLLDVAKAIAAHIFGEATLLAPAAFLTQQSRVAFKTDRVPWEREAVQDPAARAGSGDSLPACERFDLVREIAQ